MKYLAGWVILQGVCGPEPWCSFPAAYCSLDVKALYGIWSQWGNKLLPDVISFVARCWAYWLKQLVPFIVYKLQQHQPLDVI